MPPKHIPISRKRVGVQKPKHRRSRNRPETSKKLNASKLSGEPKEVKHDIEKMDKETINKLGRSLSESKARLLHSVLGRVVRKRQFRGYVLEEFNQSKGDSNQTVKSITDKVKNLKEKLRDEGKQEWAAQLKTSSLKDCMSSVRKLTEDIFIQYGKVCQISTMKNNVFKNTNWSCHSEHGSNPFVVTPSNQHEAIEQLRLIVHNVLSVEVQQKGGSTVEPRNRKE